MQELTVCRTQSGASAQTARLSSTAVSSICICEQTLRLSARHRMVTVMEGVCASAETTIRRSAPPPPR